MDLTGPLAGIGAIAVEWICLQHTVFRPDLDIRPWEELEAKDEPMRERQIHAGIDLGLPVVVSPLEREPLHKLHTAKHCEVANDTVVRIFRVHPLHIQACFISKTNTGKSIDHLE